MTTIAAGLSPANSVTLRRAVAADLNDLVALETACFDSDRLSRRSFRRLLRSQSAGFTVAILSGALVGYAALLFRAGASLARLYSIAVAPAARGFGIGERLMAAIEKSAVRRRVAAVRLEVRVDNTSAIRFYERLGYARIGTYLAYYADMADAYRYEKRLRGPDRPATAAARRRS